MRPSLCGSCGLKFQQGSTAANYFKFNLAGTSTIVLYSLKSLVPIRFASEAWPRPGLAELRSASIAGVGNTGPLSATEQKGKDCHNQDKQAQGASFRLGFWYPLDAGSEISMPFSWQSRGWKYHAVQKWTHFKLR